MNFSHFVHFWFFPIINNTEMIINNFQEGRSPILFYVVL